jgi:hypothetical protein
MKKLTTNKEAEIFGFQIAAIVYWQHDQETKISTAKPSMRRIELSVKLAASPCKNATTPHAIPAMNIAVKLLFNKSWPSETPEQADLKLGTNG